MSKCFHHPEVDAIGFCRQCGKALCPDCRREVREVIYCEDCLAATVLHPAATPSGGPNPVLAAVLGTIPGVGAIYNGEYVKALIFILIFGGSISMLESRAARGLEPLIGLFLAAFYIYMIIDAYRVAKARAGGVVPGSSSAWGAPGPGDGKASPIGPIVLIVIGAIFLFNTMGFFHFFNLFHLFRLWPLALIAIGAYMIWQRTAGGPPPSRPTEGGQP